jgi:hypothetical protein
MPSRQAAPVFGNEPRRRDNRQHGCEAVVDEADERPDAKRDQDQRTEVPLAQRTPKT